MELVPEARELRREKAVVNAARKAKQPHHRARAVWEPAGVRAREPASVPAEVRVKAKAPDRAVAGDLNKSTIQPINELTRLKGGDLMPGFDRTGPMGAGPMTGGARGRCNPATAGAIPAYTGGYGRGLALRRGFGGGFGTGAGRGRGAGRGYAGYRLAFAPTDQMRAADEVNMLKAEADYMQKSLDAINKRLAELDPKPADES